MGLTCVTTAKTGVERQFQSCGWGSCNPLTIKLHSSRAFCKMLAFGKPGIYLSVSDSPVVFLCCDRHSISLGMNRGLKERKKKKKIKKKNKQSRYPGAPPCHLLTCKWPVQRKIYSSPENGQTPNFSGNTSWERVPSITSWVWLRYVILVWKRFSETSRKLELPR